MEERETGETILTEKQASVLEQRERGRTQQEIAEDMGTTASNVSAIERAAEANVEKARRTLVQVRVLRAPTKVTVREGATFQALVDRVYERADAAGIKVDYCRPELYTHLYTHLTELADGDEISASITVGIEASGDVDIYPDETGVANPGSGAIGLG
jgi:Tfx family DNA-binding protein